MSGDIDSTNQSAYLYAQSILPRVKNICEPIKDRRMTFGYLRLFNTGAYLSVMDRLDWQEHHFKNMKHQGEYFNQVQKESPLGKRLYNLWPSAPKEKFHQTLCDFKLWNGISIYKRDLEWVDIYSFVTNEISDVANFYLNSLDLLNGLIDTFHRSAHDILNCSDTSKLAVYKNFKCIAPDRKEKQRSPPLMSRRELQCIQLTCQGLTAKEIGRRIGLSNRTVEDHLSRLKKKMGCRTTPHLVCMYMKSRMDHSLGEPP